MIDRDPYSWKLRTQSRSVALFVCSQNKRVWLVSLAFFESHLQNSTSKNPSKINFLYKICTISLHNDLIHLLYFHYFCPQEKIMYSSNLPHCLPTGMYLPVRLVFHYRYVCFIRLVYRFTITEIRFIINWKDTAIFCCLFTI
jgi:hypothetical protein